MRGGPSPEAKAEARRVYEAVGNISEASRATRITRKTLAKWIHDEGWVWIPATQSTTQVGADEVGTHDGLSVNRRTQAQVINLFQREALSEALEIARADGSISELAEIGGEVAREHPRIAKKMNLATNLFHELWLSGQADAAQVFGYRAFMAGAAKAIESGRLALGISPGAPSVSTDFDANQPIRIEEIELETQVVETDKDGRALHDEDAA